MTEQDDEKVVYFGETDARNRRLRFGIKKKDRSRHLYAIGKTGMGKSTLLENLAIQDIQNGDGMCFIDPHGKSADFLLDYVPEHRIKDVVYFAPFDMEYPVSFNVMEDVGPEQRYLVASGMMSAFKKIWVDAWSARMEYILGNIMLALLEYPGSTLVGVNRMLTDKDFRKEVVNHISDPSVKSFWVNEYANYTEKFAAEAAPAIQNKVGQFVANPLIRNIIGQAKSSFDIRDIMDNKKILIINLSKGRVGEANANLLGSMLITKIYLGAMSRADLNQEQLAEAPNFYLYVDEFQSFANESFADILSEARKYKLNLHIAHQYIEQMTEEVRAAVFGNVGTMCIFRVGAYDAEVLEKEFAPQFTAEDIVNLQKHQMYLKLMIDGVTSAPFSAGGMAPIARPEVSYMKEIIDSSRSIYARPRAQVEEELLNWIQKQFGKSSGAPSAFGSSGGGASQSGNGGQGGSSNGGGRGDNRGQSSGSQGGARSQNSSGQGGFGASQSSAGRGSTGSQAARSGQSSDNRRDTRTGADNRPQAQDSRREGSQNAPRRESNGGSDSAQQRRPQPAQSGPERRIETRDRMEKANVRENELRQAMSLSYLKPEAEEDKKAPKPENLAALREALLSVMNSGGSTPTAAEVKVPTDTGVKVSEQNNKKEERADLHTRAETHPPVQKTHDSNNQAKTSTETASQNLKHQSNNQHKAHHAPSGHEQKTTDKETQSKGGTAGHQKEVSEDVLKDLFSE